MGFICGTHNVADGKAALDAVISHSSGPTSDSTSCRWCGSPTTSDGAAVWGGGPPSSVEEGAVSGVFDESIEPALATLDGGGVQDPGCRRLAALLDRDPDSLTTPTSFIEDGLAIAPWPVTLLVPRRAAERQPEVVLRYVRKFRVPR